MASMGQLLYLEKTMKKRLIDKEFASLHIKKRPRHYHKGDCGRVLIVAGSKGMAGAAILCAKSALRTGSGLVTLCVPDEIVPLVQIGVPEATCIVRAKENIDLQRYDAIAFGPGIGVNEDNKELLMWILETYTKTLVLDADGLNAVSQYGLKDYLRERKADLVITPHIGEALRLCQEAKKPDEEFDSRWELTQKIIKEYGAVTVLKGHETIVAETLDEAYINSTGNPGMATGGSGDVLTGVIASLAGQGFSPLVSANLGVYIHGLAGDIMSKEIGEYGLIAGDLPKGVALAIKTIAEK